MQNVIVTGGSRGIGLGIARKLAAAGYRVTAIARQPSEALSEAIKEMSTAGTGALRFRAFDLTDSAGIPKLVKEIRAETGPIYGLINNAGLGTSGMLSLMPDVSIERLFQLNSIAPIVLAKYVVKSMMAGGGGRIVNISSIVSFTGYSGLSVYSATKASLVGFTRSLAREVGKLGVTVNAVAPGFIATEMTAGMDDEVHDKIIRRSALQRPVEVEDIADAVAYLLSAGAKNITGTVLTVDGGATA